MNLPLVDQAIKVINSYVANSVPWKEIDDIVDEAKAHGDAVALHIAKLKLEDNRMVLLLEDPYELDATSSDEDEEDEEEAAAAAARARVVPREKKPQRTKHKVEIDLGLTAYANACSYHGRKKTAREKETKTVDASRHALKNAERKTAQALKDASLTASVTKARKPYWFEKFLWFISSGQLPRRFLFFFFLKKERKKKKRKERKKKERKKERKKDRKRARKYFSCSFMFFFFLFLFFVVRKLPGDWRARPAAERADCATVHAEG